MKKQVIKLNKVKKPTTGFNHAIRAGEIIKGSIKEQTKRTMENIKYILSHCGSTMDDIVRAVIYFRNINDIVKCDILNL